MQDGIIKGTGNSRFLKSVPDFLSQYPTYESFVAALAAGTLPVDFNGINETGWQQLGTALNKGNLLSDETAEMLGLPNTATPNDAFSLLVARAPIGSVFWYTAQTAPAGYLICDGALVSRMDYAALFAVIGTTFGAGDGSTTFQLPDLRAAFVRGAGNQNGYSATLGAKQNASNLKFVKDRPRYGQDTTNFGLSGERNRGQTLYDMDKDERKVISYEVSASELWTETRFVSTGGVSNYIDISNQYVRPYNIALTPIIKY